MKRHQVDMFFGGTPCLCGSVQTWHRECYAGKTRAQVEAAYKRVYRALRAYLGSLRRRELIALLSRTSTRDA